MLPLTSSELRGEVEKHKFEARTLVLSKRNMESVFSRGWGGKERKDKQRNFETEYSRNPRCGWALAIVASVRARNRGSTIKPSRRGIMRDYTNEPATPTAKLKVLGRQERKQKEFRSRDITRRNIIFPSPSTCRPPTLHAIFRGNRGDCARSRYPLIHTPTTSSLEVHTSHG